MYALPARSWQWLLVISGESNCMPCRASASNPINNIPFFMSHTVPEGRTVGTTLGRHMMQMWSAVIIAVNAVALFGMISVEPKQSKHIILQMQQSYITCTRGSAVCWMVQICKSDGLLTVCEFGLVHLNHQANDLRSGHPCEGWLIVTDRYGLHTFHGEKKHEPGNLHLKELNYVFELNWCFWWMTWSCPFSLYCCAAIIYNMVCIDRLKPYDHKKKGSNRMPLVHDLAKSGTTDWSGDHLALIVAIAIHLSVIESTSERKKKT